MVVSVPDVADELTVGGGEKPVTESAAIAGARPQPERNALRLITCSCIDFTIQLCLIRALANLFVRFLSRIAAVVPCGTMYT